MSYLSSNELKLGESATASQNFKVTTNNDGTLVISRADGSQTVLSVDAAGVVNNPQGSKGGFVGFSAYQSTLQSVPNATPTKVVFQTEEFDTSAAFDNTTNYRFTPLTSGYYQINGVVGWLTGTGSGQSYVAIYKNGVLFKIGQSVVANVANDTVNALVYFNGTTDYVELFCYQTSGVAKNTQIGATQTYFQAALISRT